MYEESSSVTERGSATGVTDSNSFSYQQHNSSSILDLDAQVLPLKVGSTRQQEASLGRTAQDHVSPRLYPASSHSTFGPARPRPASASTSYTPPFTPNYDSGEIISPAYYDEDLENDDDQEMSPLPWPLAYGDQSIMVAYAAMRQGAGALHLFNSGMEVFSTKTHHGSIYRYGRRSISPESLQNSPPTVGISPKMFASWAHGCGHRFSFSDLVDQVKNQPKKDTVIVSYPGAHSLTKPRRKFSPEARPLQLSAASMRRDITPPDNDIDESDWLWSPLSPSFTTTGLTHRLAGIKPLPLPRSQTVPTLRRTKVRWGDISIKEMTPATSYYSSSESTIPSTIPGFIHVPECPVACKEKVKAWKQKVMRRFGLEKKKNNWY
ncbi:hypothetical protein QBC43DRAFT_291071 [Cladorrhinum sp. PSN259]|nr:hypothetical protein QBC43DRAFT_291071 [Cladorrhinum sp. PSN259]